MSSTTTEAETVFGPVQQAEDAVVAAAPTALKGWANLQHQVNYALPDQLDRANRLLLDAMHILG